MKYVVEDKTFLMDYLLSKSIKRGDIKNYLKYKQVMVNGMPISQFNYELNKKDIVEISKEKKVQTNKLDIIYEDKELIVINKPCGLLSERSFKEINKTAFNYVRQYLSSKKEDVYLVHRIDQYTSGVLMFVKNKKLYDLLTSSWNDLVKTREYIAIVKGDIAPKEERIETLLYENKAQLVKVSKTEGKKAITRYKTIKSNKDYSMLKVDIDTGRKNQIRVHLAYIGYPIIGDDKYGDKYSPIKRLGLHANKFEFIHPLNNKLYSFEAPIPTSFNSLFKKEKYDEIRFSNTHRSKR